MLMLYEKITKLLHFWCFRGHNQHDNSPPFNLQSVSISGSMKHIIHHSPELMFPSSGSFIKKMDRSSNLIIWGFVIRVVRRSLVSVEVLILIPDLVLKILHLSEAYSVLCQTHSELCQIEKISEKFNCW